MLNRKTFEKLIVLLKGINPDVPLPDGFEEFLWDRMRYVEMALKAGVVLEHEGAVPKNAYYVVRGLVTVQGFLDGLPFMESIYRENTIVGLREFMEGKVSEHTVTATKGTLVWSISAEHMEEIYARWPEMKAFALQTALRYLEMKKDRRNVLLVMPLEERVMEFYNRFQGLLPVRASPILDPEIVSYLSMNVYRFRKIRKKHFNS